MSVDYRETLVTLLRAENLEECAKTLGITRAALIGRIQIMKKAGVKVPRVRRAGGLTRLEVAQLNDLINKHARELVKASQA